MYSQRGREVDGWAESRVDHSNYANIEVNWETGKFLSSTGVESC